MTVAGVVGIGVAVLVICIVVLAVDLPDPRLRAAVVLFVIGALVAAAHGVVQHQIDQGCDCAPREE